MKKCQFLFATFTALIFISQAHAFNVDLLANNKEAYSRVLTNEDKHNLEQWTYQHPLQGDELRKRSRLALSDTFNEMERLDTNCELGLIARLNSDALIHGLIQNKSELTSFIAYLRESDLIDDILLKLLKDSAAVSLKFDNISQLGDPGRPFNLYTRDNNDADLDKIYSGVQTWPDDIQRCSIDAYYYMTQKIEWNNSRDRDRQMTKLNYLAYINNKIDKDTYHKLDIMVNSDVLGWPVFFNRYADVVNNAKDKLTTTPERKTDNNFSVEYVSRREKLTQRSSLYMNYNSTQIMILAQLIEKTAKRIDSYQVSLHWQYTEDPNGGGEVYIFSPMEQYRAAIKMLRKDMAEIMRSEAFAGKGLQYEHIIAAAYEAGFVKSEELDYVLKFEEFWNPKTPKWKRYANFAFSLAGTAAFYLPPPWNIIGAVGLVLTQSRVITGDEQPDPDDNWNVII